MLMHTSSLRDLCIVDKRFRRFVGAVVEEIFRGVVYVVDKRLKRF